MLAIEGVIRIFVIIFLEFVSFDRFYAQSESCYDVDNKTICYFRPNLTSMYWRWDDAWKVCKEHNSTLPAIENRQIEEKLKMFVESKTSLTYDMWLVGREVRTNIWQWLNGKSFDRHDILEVKGEYDTNAVINRKLKYYSRYPKESKYYICQCTDCTLCQNKATIRFGNGCIFVNNNESLNLVNARNRCLDNGGDLATFEEDEDLDILQRNRSLLYEEREYWIGLRQNWWIWNETDSDKEIKYSNWYIYENRLNQECLFIYLNDYKWSQSSCTVAKPFICQRVKTSGTEELDTSTPTFNLPETNGSFKTFELVLLVAALIGATLVIIVTVVLVKTLKKARNKEVNVPSPDEKPRLSGKQSTPRIESKSSEVNEMSTCYAEIPRAVNQEDNDEHRDEPQPGIVYATLEFDGNKAVYEEPMICKQPTQERRSSDKNGASKGNIQPGGFSASSAQYPDGTIYANM